MWCPLQVDILHFGQPVTPKPLPIACEMHTNSTSFILALWDATLRPCITGSRWFEIRYRFYLQAYSGLCFMIHEPFTTSATLHTGKNGNPNHTAMQVLTLSNPIFLPTAYSPALICFGQERGW
jgi:hypothetical protein